MKDTGLSSRVLAVAKDLGLSDEQLDKLIEAMVNTVDNDNEDAAQSPLHFTCDAQRNHILHATWGG